MFERIEKISGRRQNLSPNEVSVCKTGFGFGRGCLTWLYEDYVEIYIDKENDRIGFKATDNILTGFKLYKKDALRINCAFAKYVSIGRHTAIFEDDMIIIKNVEFIK